MLRVLLVTISVVAYSVTYSAKIPAASQNEIPRVSVRLSLSRPAYNVGEPVPVKVEVSNEGDVRTLIGNYISIASGQHPSHIDFELKDSEDRLIPQTTQRIADSFADGAKPSPAVALLKSWLLLNPHSSFSSELILDPHLFYGLNKPGTYSLSALYSSNGNWYQGVLGLTEADMKAIPYVAWTGKIRTNTVSLKIVSRVL